MTTFVKLFTDYNDLQRKFNSDARMYNDIIGVNVDYTNHVINLGYERILYRSTHEPNKLQGLKIDKLWYDERVSVTDELEELLMERMN